MKKIILLFIFIICVIETQSQTLHFKYDNAGNQIKRCFNCSVFRSAPDLISKIEINNDNTTLKYFPNPVSDKLTISWSNTKVRNIQVFDINGKLLANYTINKKLIDFKVPFNNYSNGTYIIKILFVNNKIETLKIIKI